MVNNGILASRIILTAGKSVNPAPTGKYYLYLRDDGVFIRVDDQGQQEIVGRDGTQIPKLVELTDVMDTDSIRDGDILVKHGNKFIFQPMPMPSFNGHFFAVNKTQQSHQNSSRINIIQDNDIVNAGGLFDHSTEKNPHEIKCDFNGYIEISYNITLINSDSDKDVLGQAYLSINDQKIPYISSYGYSRYRSYGNKMTISLVSGYVNVKKNDILKLHTAVSRDTSMGDRLDVSTSYNESTISLKGQIKND